MSGTVAGGKHQAAFQTRTPEDKLATDESVSLHVDQGYVRTASRGTELIDLEPYTGGTPQFGAKTTFQLDAVGDLLADVMLGISFDASVSAHGSADHYGAVVQNAGYMIFEKIEFEVNSRIIETLTGQEMYLYNELTKKDEYRADYIVATPPPTTSSSTFADQTAMAWSFNYLLPLQLFFAGKYGPGYHLPMQALSNGCNTKIHVTLKPIHEVFYYSSSALKKADGSTDADFYVGASATELFIDSNTLGDFDEAASTSAVTITNMAMKLRLVYYHLNAVQASQLLAQDSTKIIEEIKLQTENRTLQAGAASAASPDIKKIDLQFVHPVKELWVVVRSNVTDHGPNCFTHIEAGSDTVSKKHGALRCHPAGNSTLKIEFAELIFNGVKTSQIPIDRKYMQEKIVPSLHQNQFDGTGCPVFCLAFSAHPDKLNMTAGHVNFGQIAHATLNLHLSHSGASNFNASGTVEIDIFARSYNWVSQKAGKMWKVYM